MGLFMSKKTTALHLALPARKPEEPIGRWLFEALRSGILEGRYRPGLRLPSTRDIALSHGISRGLVVGVFEELKGEGYLESRQGSGTRVSQTLPEALLNVSAAPTEAPAEPMALPISKFASKARDFRLWSPRPDRAFQANQPAIDLFPVDLWTQIATRRLRQSTRGLLRGCGPMGYLPLQEAIADYLNSSRGVHCAAEQVAVVAGAQAGMDTLARIFIDPGDKVALESPGYNSAKFLFQAMGAEILDIPVDDHGMKVDGKALAGARVVYVTPAHQFPLGVSMSLVRRLELLEWAAKTGAVIMEDDYDSEFRYSGKPLPAVQGLDRHGNVFLIGSFGKVLFPSLRLGYIVVPKQMVERFASVQAMTNLHVPVHMQAVLADFMESGHFARHIRRMREIYAQRLATLMACAGKRLNGLLTISGIEAGLQTVGWLQGGVDGDTAAKAAARQGIELQSLVGYGPAEVVNHGVHLGFAGVSCDAIEKGVAILAEVLEKLQKGTQSQPNE